MLSVGGNKMYIAKEKSHGGYISGEVKLGITLRLLAGGSALDLGVIFNVTPNHCNTIMLYVLSNWIIRVNIGDINMGDYLYDNDAMTKVSDGFSKRSNGAFKGAIGALDGWLVRILCPSLQRME